MKEILPKISRGVQILALLALPELGGCSTIPKATEHTQIVSSGCTPIHTDEWPTVQSMDPKDLPKNICTATLSSTNERVALTLSTPAHPNTEVRFSGPCQSKTSSPSGTYAENHPELCKVEKPKD